MKIRAILFVFLLAAGVCFATDVEIFIQPYLLPGESGSIGLATEVGGVVYYTVSTNRTINFVVAERDGEMKITVSPAEIGGILQKYVEVNRLNETAYLSNEGISQINAHIDTYARSREKEGICKHDTGTDRYPCVDTESCFRACYSPYCQGAAQATGFLDAVKEFVAATDRISAEMPLLLANVSLVSYENEDPAAALDASVGIIKSIKQESAQVVGNPLFAQDKFYFCPAVEYDISALDSSLALLSQSAERIRLLKHTSEYGDSIVNESIFRNSRKHSIDRCNLKINETAAQFEQIDQSAPHLKNFTEIKEKLATLAQIKEQLFSRCASENFAEANESIESFSEQKVEAEILIENYSEAYAKVEELVANATERIQNISGVGITDNSLLFEIADVQNSVEQVQEELQIITTYEDLATLQGVLIGSLEKLDDIEKRAKQGWFSFDLGSVAITAGIILAIIVIIVFGMRRGSSKLNP